MSYISILERVEQGDLTINQAIKEIEKESMHQHQKKAKKMKLSIVNEGRKIYIPGVPFRMIKHFFKLCAPFIHFEDEDVNKKLDKKELNVMLEHLEDLLMLMKEYPPFELIKVSSKDTVIKIMTK
ncbi:MAG: hypothetical protein K2G70_01865 [Turicibacter sp.]|nr:hypothetical protein [Turicibacter sp.]